MNDKDFSLDDILLEVGLQGTPKDPLDVDALIQDISEEKKEKAAQEKPEEEELPTKRFVTQKAVIRNDTTRIDKVSEEKAVAKIENSGPISIDIETIREGQKPPKPIPADVEEEENHESLELHFNKEREEHDSDRRIDIAPAFSKLVEKVKLSPFPQWESVIAGEKNSSVAKGVLLLVLSLLSLGISMIIYSNAAAELGDVPHITILLIAGVIGVIAGLFGIPVIASGVKSIRRMEPNRDIIPAVAYAFCMIQYLTQLIFPKGLTNANIHQYLPVGILIMSLSYFAKGMTLKTALNNIKTLKSMDDTYEGLVIWDNRAATELSKGLTNNTPYPVVNRKVEEISHFCELSFSMDATDRSARDITVFGTAGALLVALFVFLFTLQQHLAMTVLTAFVCVFSSAVNLFAVCSPLLKCSKVTSLFNCLVSGEKCGVEYSDVNVAVTEAKELFPRESVVLNGIKTFEGMRIDEAILDAASVLNCADSILTHTFLRIIEGKTELLSKAENLHYEDGLGISAWIDNRRILIGNRDLMATHNIRVPSIDYEKRFTSEGSDLVYLSASGELTAVFIFSLQPDVETEEAVRMIFESDVALTVKTSDCIITKQRLSKVFGIEPDFFKIMPTKLNKLYDECSQSVKVRPAVAVNDGTFSSMSCSVSAAKKAKIMMKIAWVVAICSVILGALLIAVFGFLGATKQLTPFMMFIYPLIWLVIHSLLQKIIRI